jgi:prevent-host-death family protein
MIEAYAAGRAPAFELYGLGLEHKHVAELQNHARLARRPIFVPSVGNFRQGMLVSLPLHLDTLPGRPKPADLEAALAARYAGSKLVKLVAVAAGGADPGRLEPEALNDTDRMELRVFANEKHRHALLVARLDNLGKGASGAAVQNIALMPEVGIRELRDHLSRYLERVQDGEVVVVTDRGRAIARVVAMNGERPIDRLIQEGLVTPARKPKSSLGRPVKAAGSVSDLVSDQRR